MITSIISEDITYGMLVNISYMSELIRHRTLADQIQTYNLRRSYDLRKLCLHLRRE